MMSEWKRTVEGRYLIGYREGPEYSKRGLDFQRYSEVEYVVVDRYSGESRSGKFESNGCTLVPDSFFGRDFRKCCVVHDIRFTSISSLGDLVDAGDELKSCILRETGQPELAGLYGEATKFTGPLFAETVDSWLFADFDVSSEPMKEATSESKDHPNSDRNSDRNSERNSDRKSSDDGTGSRFHFGEGRGRMGPKASAL